MQSIENQKKTKTKIQLKIKQQQNTEKEEEIGHFENAWKKKSSQDMQTLFRLYLYDRKPLGERVLVKSFQPFLRSSSFERAKGEQHTKIVSII